MKIYYTYYTSSIAYQLFEMVNEINPVTCDEFRRHKINATMAWIALFYTLRAEGIINWPEAEK